MGHRTFASLFSNFQFEKGHLNMEYNKPVQVYFKTHHQIKIINSGGVLFSPQRAFLCKSHPHCAAKEKLIRPSNMTLIVEAANMADRVVHYGGCHCGKIRYKVEATAHLECIDCK